MPLDGEGKPVDGDGSPPDGEGSPAEGDGNPPDGDGIPEDGDGMPPDGDGMPPDGEGMPPDGDGIPDDDDGEGIDDWLAHAARPLTAPTTRVNLISLMSSVRISHLVWRRTARRRSRGRATVLVALRPREVHRESAFGDLEPAAVRSLRRGRRGAKWPFCGARHEAVNIASIRHVPPDVALPIQRTKQQGTS